MTSAAQIYDAVLVPSMVASWAETLVLDANIEAGMRVLDIACGTGVVARQVARRLEREGREGRAVGIDIDQGMIEVARSVATKAALPIDFHLGSASELPFETSSFDAALCLQGLQYFPDRLRAMQESHRVLKPNSLLVTATWSDLQSCKGYWALITSLEKFGIDTAPVRKPFSLSDAKELSTLAERAGFSEVKVRSEQHRASFDSARAFVEAMTQSAPSSRVALEQVPTSKWHDFIASVEEMLDEWKQNDRLAFPMKSNILIARR